jgi:hypothetical protein
MEEERWLVCDTPEAVLGPAVASFLCQVVASRVQMLTARRLSGSRPFGCFADEFQEYSNPSFAKGIATGREFGLAWFLIHQSRANQGIGREVAGAVHLCGSRWYFQQAPEDAKAAVDAIADIPGSITPFPGGIVASGSKVGSKYKFMNASTNEKYCPTLREKVEDSKVPANVKALYELVIDGVDEKAVRDAMAVGIRAAAKIPGVVFISASNYGGTLGPVQVQLRDLL